MEKSSHEFGDRQHMLETLHIAYQYVLDDMQQHIDRHIETDKSSGPRLNADQLMGLG